MPQNSMGIRGYDYVEFYVGSAKQVAFWHQKALGLDVVAYMGPETGHRDRVSYLLATKSNLKIVITSALQPTTYEVQSFVSKHGDGVKRWTVEVVNVAETFEKAVKNGGVPVKKPYRLEDKDGFVEQAAIRLYDDTEINFINYDNYQGLFKPGYEFPVQKINISRQETGLKIIDHIVGNVHINEMDYWANYINTSLDFETFVSFGPGDISTKYSALLSKVVRSKDSVIKNPINEPLESARKSQIDEFTEQYHGSGIQHVALVTTNIIETVENMKLNGVEFLDPAPQTYYDDIRRKSEERGGLVTEDISELQRLGILCDVEVDSGGYLLQLFTKPLFDRPTFFYEIIQRRKGASGFGQGNFLALFEAIERDQERRGNL
ncbi:MAG: 4-hydroxyphenylpyruvate dioxygenase [Candidatus Kapabacteria bacterium]|nr:4-hydroxyphenylpyruvate dioxygenase [Ignavibacteriota bacterium]MCW5883752.1 4-hydroxyphenylpyruvate dioxygenase [Candidatus Kapabacteria bacterium]